MKEYKTCPRCKTTKPASGFYLRRDGKDLTPYCRECHNNETKGRQRKLKQMAVEYKGGKCVICGYDKCASAMDFHHIDSGTKKFALGHAKLTSFEKVKDELDKCILLCCRCHREVECGFITISHVGIVI